MTPEQTVIQCNRLLFEEQLFTAQSRLGEIVRSCTDHVIIKGRTTYSPRQGRVVNTMEGKSDDWNGGCYSVSCAICGNDFGWHCPKNPKGYCEYDDQHGGNCKHCGISEERK